MFFDDSSTRPFDDNNDFCMNEECDGTSVMLSSNDRISPPPNFYSGLPSSPADNTDSCLVIVEEQRHNIHSITCSPASSSCSSASTSPPVVRAFSSPPKRVNWREHMRNLHRSTIEESIHRLTTMRGGIEKKKRGKGGHVGVGGRRTHRPGCAMHVWSLVKHIHESDSCCNCQHETSGVSNELVDRLRRLTRFDSRISELSRPHRFTYSYKIEYSLPSISEDGEEGSSSQPDEPSTSSRPIPVRSSSLPLTRPQLGRVSRSVSPSPSRPHCSSPAAPEDAQQLQTTVVLSEEEMCARLSALPIGYHTTATVAALESALHSSLSLMDTEADD
ncbi:hypothetical protein PMAYCL1PPCAC_04243 [Pristionchus mayeri]|uniref:Uncharacterized protein n=1 Tax=Pristionchus mayeri TaxID=1317129 RepID=A0AAN4Z8P7_9BILA|nr:hypothetical protein PMAYCL1PPCAC_04243 [Pristionchus mayeri]